MTVEPKLGRWRTRDGSVATIEKKVGVGGTCWHGNIGARFHTWYDDGRWIDEPGATSSRDLIEYLGPLDQPPFDLAAFIAGLKPGDVYRQNDGEKGTFCGRYGVQIAIVDGSQMAWWLNVENDNDRRLPEFPAGPWVEPPKAIELTLVANDDAVELMRRDCDTTKEFAVYAQRITYTPGKGFELGEVIKR